MRDDTFVVKPPAMPLGRLRGAAPPGRLSNMRGMLALFLGLGLVACGGKSKKDPSVPTTGSGTAAKKPNQEWSPQDAPTLCSTKVDLSPCDTKKNKIGSQFDLNNDGDPDVWRIMGKKDDQTEYVACKLVDLDHDKKHTVDYLVMYGESATVLVEQFDLDFDRVMDVQYRYDEVKKKRYLAERDFNSDSKWDVCEEFDDAGELVKIQRDRNYDGKPDQWELYRDGDVEAILYDNDGDEKVDERDEAPQKSAGATVPEPAPASQP